MPTTDHIQFDLIIPAMIAANHKQVLRLIAHEASQLIGIQERILFDRIVDKEKESVSAMGQGVAVPHLHLSGLQKPMCIYVRLKNAVDFHAPDNVPVDIVCLLLTPERDGAAYLRTLARLSRMLRNPQFCHKLRQAVDERSIRALFEGTSTRIAA